MSNTKTHRQAAASAHISDTFHTWERTGAIGNSHPTTKQQALRQSVAVGLREAGVPKKRVHNETPVAPHAKRSRTHSH